MNKQAKIQEGAGPLLELTLGQMLDFMARHPERPLVFHLGDRPVQAGYHVTEVKSGRFSSLDCGANPEGWSEIFVQLLDIPERDKAPMSAGKFVGIIGKVEGALGLDRRARLTFEVSDGRQPMVLMRATAVHLGESAIHIDLAPRAASCKPRDRWLESPLAEAAPVGEAGCCGAPARSAGQSACCAA